MPAENFNDVVNAAVNDIATHGSNVERIAYWQERLRRAAEAAMTPQAQMQAKLDEALHDVFARLIDKKEILKLHPGVGRFTIERLRESLRAELAKRIAISADLIVLNKRQVVEETMRRFSGWASSVPSGGSKVVDKKDEKDSVKKGLASLPFIERRVLIDQGHKLTASLNDILAKDGGAIAAKWVSHWHQQNYDYRETHKERELESEKKPYVIRDNWAITRSLMKLDGAKYTDQMTQPGEEVYCFPGDSRIPFANSVEKGYRRFYRGQLTEIATASGKTLRATPNHPILTSKGWVAIGSLNEGDDVIEIADEIFGVSEKNEHDTIPLLAEIFGALGELGAPEMTRGQSEQFHGDGTDSDVDIINVAGPLRFGRKSFLDKCFGKQIFSFAFVAASTISAFSKFADFCFGAFTRFVRVCCKSLSPVNAFSGHTNKASLATISGHSTRQYDSINYKTPRDLKFFSKIQNTLSSLMACSNEVCIKFNYSSLRKFTAKIKETVFGAVHDYPHTHTQSLGDLPNTFPFRTQASRIVKIESHHFSGHVYNLQTESGWFVTEGIITHNCRCRYLYIYDLTDLPASMITQKGRAALEAANKAYKERANAA